MSVVLAFSRAFVCTEIVLIQVPATIAIGYGVVSDIASPSERGGYVGAVLLG